MPPRKAKPEQTTQTAAPAEGQVIDTQAVHIEPDPKPEPDTVAADERVAAPAVLANQLARRDDIMAAAFQGLMPSSLGEAIDLARNLAGSQALPKSMQTPAAVLTVIMAGMEIGLSPIRATQSIVNIKGNLALKADLQLALVRRSGTLDYYNEGFELARKTDLKATDGVEDRRLERRLTAARCPDSDMIADQIYALVEDLEPGRPYGWAVCKRKGDPQVHLRVFSWADAELFVYNERDDDDASGGRGPAVKKKLSEKSNYKNSPQDMYPKRARVRVLAVTHSDVLGGMPAVEALDGVNYDDGGHEPPAALSTEDMIAIELKVIERHSPDLAKQIVAGMDQLKMGLAKRLVKLREHQNDPTRLVEWMKTEWANRHVAAGRAMKDVLSSTTVPAEAAKPKPETEQPKVETKPAAEEPKAPAPETTTQPAAMQSAVQKIAERFKANVKGSL